ncbi:MAG: hypothetical protein NDJ72_09495 [Elusimicrobia bacterium]|nr:hypothetical protein [Elusimicrobiota bacterium]
MSQPIHEIRVALHARTLDIAALGNTREINLAKTLVQQARMLLGKALGLLGEATPYPKADDAQSREIAPRADVADYKPNLPGEAIAAIKTVRAALQVELDALARHRRELWARDYGAEAEFVYRRAYTDLLLAKMWLGEGLAKLAEKKPAAAEAPVQPPAA